MRASGRARQRPIAASGIQTVGSSHHLETLFLYGVWRIITILTGKDAVERDRVTHQMKSRGASVGAMTAATSATPWPHGMYGRVNRDGPSRGDVGVGHAVVAGQRSRRLLLGGPPPVVAATGDEGQANREVGGGCPRGNPRLGYARCGHLRPPLKSSTPLTPSSKIKGELAIILATDHHPLI
jgi:hypothetical protein